MNICKVCGIKFAPPERNKNKKTCGVICAHKAQSNALKGKMPKNLSQINANKKGSGNPMFGKKHSKEYIEKRISKIRGENHGNWKGERAGYCAVHDWIKRYFGIADRCENTKCEELYNNKQRKISPFQWANITGKYKRDKKNWRMLCVFCHNRFDKNIISLQFKDDTNIFTKRDIQT